MEKSVELFREAKPLEWANYYWQDAHRADKKLDKDKKVSAKAKDYFEQGRCLQLGIGVEKNRVKALECYRLAAAEGHPQAQQIIAITDKVDYTAQATVAPLDKKSQKRKQEGVQSTEQKPKQVRHNPGPGFRFSTSTPTQIIKKDSDVAPSDVLAIKPN